MRFISKVTEFGQVRRAVLATALTLAAAVAAGEPARLLRFPAIHGDQLVFTYAGDLYTVAAQGGVARRLTGDESSYEMFARFSPDGRWLAFTAQYDGNTEVYVMPAEGGVPRRLTYTATLERDDVSDRMGPNNIVMTWRDNQTVIYRSRRTQWNPFKGELTLARIDGGPPETLPLPRGGWCSFSPDGKQLAYNRVFREFRTWKRYRGGQADDIWIYDFENKTTERIAPDSAQDIYPMWHGDRIYFVSERDPNRQANLYVYDLKSKQIRALTAFTEFAVKFPSPGDRAIVFENGGYIHRLDLDTEKVTQVPIEIHEDFAAGRGAWRDLAKSASPEDLAPDGARALFAARGELFTIPAKYGPTRNLTQTPGVHERDGAWSPDGKWIAYIADATGEDELYVRPQDGSGTPTQLTTGADTYKYGPVWSPDSKRLLWSDKKNRLQFVEVATKEVTLVDRSGAFEIHDFTWAPDSQWIAYTRPEERRFPNIHLFALESRQKTQVTDGWFDVRGPEFASDGKLLFFVSSRTFSPTYGQTEWNHVYSDMAGIFFVTLTRDAKSPFAPRSDEVKVRTDDDKKPDAKKDEPAKDAPKPGPDPKAEAARGTAKPAPAPAEAKDTPKKDGDKKDAEKKDDKKVTVKVDAEGLAQRIGTLPLPASAYGQLTSVGDKLYYSRKGKLFLFELDKQKETELGEFAAYRVSADQKKMLVSGGGSHAIVDLPIGRIDTKDRTLDLTDVRVRLDRPAEWAQIYAECWRQMRDFMYDPNLHSVDWPAMRRRYEPLLAHVRHRADLTYVVGELIGELNVGHAYVGGGDYPKPERVAQGLLGAVLERHSPSGFYRIAQILPGQNWDRKLRSPLTEIGVGVKPGDYIVAVDARPTDRMTDLYAALVGRADKQVTLRVNTEPKAEGARDAVVVPTADEQPLYYLKWVLGNIDQVAKATDGKVGYVHVPDMGVPGLNEFAKFYYPQLHKEALIVDCRGNGGGNVSPMIIERLRREPAMWTIARNGSVNVDPAGQVLGPKVLLLDQFSASDGDIVGYRFRKHKLGPIIGQRSWGGVVGIRGSLPLLDGGYLNRPEFSRFDLEAREWIMEGVGVTPDIEVDNDPAHEFAGIDDQLNRAIDEIKKLMALNPVRIPTPPPYPNKSR
jgi:tricorn protease